MSEIKFWVAMVQEVVTIAGEIDYINMPCLYFIKKPRKNQGTWSHGGNGCVRLGENNPIGNGLRCDDAEPKEVTLVDTEQFNALVKAAQQASRIVDILKDLHNTHSNICNCWMCEIPLELNRALKPFEEVG